MKFLYKCVLCQLWKFRIPLFSSKREIKIDTADGAIEGLICKDCAETLQFINETNKKYTDEKDVFQK